MIQNRTVRQAAKRVVAVDTAVRLAFRIKIKKHDIGSTAAWLRNRLDYLGPTFVKLGQIASSRKDIVGEDIARNLRGLQDKARPIDSAEVDTLIETIREKTKGVVAEIQRDPLATASIGQIHRGKLASGREIVIKLRRPNITDDIASDLTFLKSIASLLTFLKVPDSQGLDSILRDVEQYMQQESNFLNETKNLMDLARIYRKSDHFKKEPVVVPRVYANLTTEEWIVMDYIENAGTDCLSPQQAREFVRNLMTVFIKQLMEHGIIHGDPHPGNIGKLADGRVILYDCGNVVYLDDKERFLIKELVYLLIAKNKYAVARVLPSLGVKVLDKDKLYEYIDTYVKYLETIDYKMLADMYDPNTSMPVRFEGKLLRIIKAFGLLEGICKDLDPTFNYFQLMDVYVTETLFDEDFLVYKINQDLGRLQSWPTSFFSRYDMDL